MSLLLARRESRDPRPSGGANHGGLCCWEPEAFDQKEITKARCHSSQSTKHGFEQILKSCFLFLLASSLNGARATVATRQATLLRCFNLLSVDA